MKILQLISRSCLILSSVLVLVSCINGKLQADEVFKTWGFNGAADGWKPLAQVEITAGDTTLTVKGTGNDPHFIAPVEGPSGWIKVSIRAKFSGQFNSQLFWTTTKQPGTSEGLSVRFKMIGKGDRFTDIDVFLKTEHPITQLRFDPHSAPMTMEVDSITMAATDAPPADPATDPAGLKVASGFKVELLYSVPAADQGSWVSMTVDDEGRLITCDQYGKLYRVTPPAIGSTEKTQVEPIEIEIGEAQGLLYAFDSLYVVVNRGKKFASGVYRVRDTDGDDQFDSLETLKLLDGGGEHGPHSIIKSPDGKSLYVVCGNSTKLPDDIKRYRLPKNWDEDQLLPRQPCSNNHNTGVLAPGGFVCNMDPDGKNWTLVAAGFRNPFDIAFNDVGELFTYDADMEMDVGTPWYRPTRVNHVVSGGEYGWRYGTGKWPDYSPDSLPAVAEIGQGSPTGILFGTRLKFPMMYQRALFVCDWTYGRLYAVHFEAEGASYSSHLEEFITGTPMPLTDLVANPKDGAMYITIGGRRTQSGLYRVTYSGGELQTKLTDNNRSIQLRKLRRRLEQYHGLQDASAVAVAWPYLGHSDRHIRYAARIAVEHQDLEGWREKAIKEPDTRAAIHGLLGLIRSGTEADQIAAVKRLSQLDVASMDDSVLIEWLRTVGVGLARSESTDIATRVVLREKAEGRFPTATDGGNHELTRLLVYLDSKSVVTDAMTIASASVTQEDLLFYGMALRVATEGWDSSLRKSYFENLNRAEEGAAVGDFIGGGHYQIYIQNMRKDAVALLNDKSKTALDAVINAEIASAIPGGSPTPRKFIKNWTVDELIPHVASLENGGRSFDAGKQLFRNAACIQCHRFANRGGILGPDITGSAKRYSMAVMLREIIDPSIQVSDQFENHVIITDEGKLLEGRILSESDDTVTLAVDPRQPESILQIPTVSIEAKKVSRTSLMPKGLLNTLTREEILDLLAYILSAGDSEHDVFK